MFDPNVCRGNRWLGFTTQLEIFRFRSTLLDVRNNCAAWLLRVGLKRERFFIYILYSLVNER